MQISREDFVIRIYNSVWSRRFRNTDSRLHSRISIHTHMKYIYKMRVASIHKYIFALPGFVPWFDLVTSSNNIFAKKLLEPFIKERKKKDLIYYKKIVFLFILKYIIQGAAYISKYRSYYRIFLYKNSLTHVCRIKNSSYYSILCNIIRLYNINFIIQTIVKT